MKWDPEKYLKFKQERFLPFEDLFNLIIPKPELNIIDLGCGSGELTVMLADRLKDSKVLGIDNSTDMIDKALEKGRDTVKFQCGNIESVSGKWDLIFSNAALHWVNDHSATVSKLIGMLSPGGQLAAQFPSANRNPAHRILAATAKEEPYTSALGNWEWEFPVLSIEDYAELLYRLGAKEITSFEKVYPHVLGDADDVYDFTSGTSIIPYIERLPDKLKESFREKYRENLWKHWETGPVFFAFRRILISAVKD